MKLGELVDGLESFGPDETIYAARPWGANTTAAVAMEPESGGVPPEAAGLEYFLKVDLAIEAASRAPKGRRLAAVIFYAENDAYVPAD